MSSDLKRLKLASVGGATPEAPPAQPEAVPAQPEAPKPRFEVSNGGVFYIGTKVDPQSGVTTELPPLWLSDKLEILGRGVDEGGEFYRILKWHSRGNGQEQNHAVNLGMVGDRQSWATLRSGGLALAPSRRQLEYLASWLQTGEGDDMHVVSHRGGWNYGAYVLPSGEVIGTPSKPLYYNGDRSHAPAYRSRGTIESWRENVAKLSAGNSRPMLAIGAALAAPMLHLVGLESGGFHLFGPSGCGKTTSANIGASVWGLPREQVLNWDATALALSNAAAARNDGLMLLDEMGQGNPEAVNTAAYRLFNGTGKMQGARDGGNRDMLRWRVLVLSTGEIDLAGFMSGGGKRTRAGQEVRLASLPADAGRNLGAFENLHGLSDSNALAKALDVAFGENYGTVGRAFVAEVSAHSEECAKRLQAAIVSLWDRLPNQASGQVRRVASRFAVTGEALEIATDFGLTGWKKGDGTRAILQCFDSWLERYGLGNREDEQIMAQAEAWFGAHSYGRFIDWGDASSNCLPNVHDAAGYRRSSGGEISWLVFQHVFTDEIAQGYDKVAAADILAKAGMLQKSSDGKSTTPHRTPDITQLRRFYKFTSSVRSLPDDQR